MFSADGHRVVYDREVPFELRTHEFAEGPQVPILVAHTYPLALALRTG
jgi:hypothetical protein